MSRTERIFRPKDSILKRDIKKSVQPLLLSFLKSVFTVEVLVSVSIIVAELRKKNEGFLLFWLGDSDWSP
jgi:hypothetical protein